jgi:hypothetical protein
VDVKFTKHATSMLKERNFTADQIKEAVENPDWTEGGELLHVFKRENNKVLHVVGREEGDNVYKVVTVYYDRRKR